MELMVALSLSRTSFLSWLFKDCAVKLLARGGKEAQKCLWHPLRFWEQAPI